MMPLSTITTLIQDYASTVVPLFSKSDDKARQRAIAKRFLELLNTYGLKALRAHHMPAHLTVSAWLCNSKMTHVALCHHKKIGKWIPMGGHVERQDLSLSRACLREVREESSLLDSELRLHSTLPFDLDIHAIPATSKLPAHSHYDVRFLITTPSLLALTLGEEAYDLRWVSISEISAFTTEESTLRQVRKMNLWRQNSQTFSQLTESNGDLNL